MARRRRACALTLGIVLVTMIATPRPAAAQDLAPTAQAAVLMDAGSGTVLYEKEPRRFVYPASITKIMLLALTFEALEAGRVALDDPVVASYEAKAMGGSQIWLEPGEEMSLRDLIYAVAVASANDASVAVGEHLAGSEQAFVQHMNEKAIELGMKDTTFKNCTGLHMEGHQTTAYDVALMCRYALRFPQLTEYTSVWEHYLRGGKSWLVNTNRLVKHYRGATGLKTGWTDKAGYCVAATAKRNGMALISVVMGCADSKSRFAEAARLLDYGFANFVSVPLFSRGEIVGTARVLRGRQESVSLVAADDFSVTVKRGREKEVKEQTFFEKVVEAPVARGQKLGRVVALSDGQEVGEVALVSPVDIPRASFLRVVARLLARLVKFGR